jgi:hypothetical protein
MVAHILILYIGSPTRSTWRIHIRHQRDIHQAQGVQITPCVTVPQPETVCSLLCSLLLRTITETSQTKALLCESGRSSVFRYHRTEQTAADHPCMSLGGDVPDPALWHCRCCLGQNQAQLSSARGIVAYVFIAPLFVIQGKLIRFFFFWSDEYIDFVEFATELAGALRNVIFVDNVVYQRAEHGDILRLLEEHITENMVKVMEQSDVYIRRWSC